MIRFLGFVLFCGISLCVSAQDYTSAQNESLFSIKTSYGYFLAGGDLKSRFGPSFKFSGGLDYITQKGLGFTIEYGYAFGSDVREDVLSPLRTNSGIILGIDGVRADIFFRMRGLQFGGQIYKIIGLKSYKNGLKLGLGSGVMAHYIKFLDTSSSVAQLFGDYKKGYDRLSRGAYLQEEIGWAVHSQSGYLNGSIVFEFIQGYTRSVRENQFYLPPTKDRRLDLYSGIKINWKIPLIRINKGEKIFY